MDIQSVTATDGFSSPSRPRRRPGPKCLDQGVASRKRSFGAASASASVSSQTLPSPTQQSPSDTIVATTPGSRRRNQKVSRACDLCKHRKAKCSGTLPCTKCARKGLTCLYDAKYSRGRPPTPPLYIDETHRDYETTHLPLNTHHEPGLNPDAPFQATNNDNDTITVTGPSEGIIADTSAPGNPSLPVPRMSSRAHDSQGPVSRASPELGAAEIQGQFFDPTSGVTFLHRAWKRLSKHHGGRVPPDKIPGLAATENEPWMLAGDRPLPSVTADEVWGLTLPGPTELQHLLSLYFDVCIATYRILHRPSVESWLGAMQSNQQQRRPIWHGIGKAKASIVLTVLSIATAHYEKSKGLRSREDEAQALARSDRLFCAATHLTETETGFPRLESAQTRIIQTLYLLTTSRMNRAWYNFGDALQIISALGLHRKAAKNRHLASRQVDYVQAQTRIRTFWTAYVLDNYLGVVFGRPRHYHDDDIDQDLPDRVDDEDMTARGPVKSGEAQGNSHLDALIFHTRIARIIGNISRDVYSIKPISEQDRIDAAHRHSQELREWRESLPAHLGSVPAAMLITSFRRQSIVLNLAYCHAIMHANRLFLLGNLRAEKSEAQISECIGAAQAVLEVVDGLTADGFTFHAFWWTQYVAFCALVVVFVWDIQMKRRGIELRGQEERRHARLMDLAERCQTHLAQATASNSPSRRYAVILEEFRSEAMGLKPFQQTDGGSLPQQAAVVNANGPMHLGAHQVAVGDGFAPEAVQSTGAGGHGYVEMMGQGVPEGMGSSLLDEWQMADWLDLDSSAYGPFLDVDMTSVDWVSDMAEFEATASC